jgi:hypothetical protein
MYAETPGLVTAGGHHRTIASPSYNQWFALQATITQAFHADEKTVKIHMNN